MSIVESFSAGETTGTGPVRPLPKGSLIQFLPNYQMAITYQADNLLELEGRSNYWRMLTGNLLIIAGVLTTAYLLNTYFGLFQELDTPGGIASIVLAIIAYIAFNNIRAARYPWYAVRRVRFSANGIEYNRFKNPARSTVILSPQIDRLIVTEANNSFRFYLNGGKRSRFTIDLGGTDFAGKGNQFIAEIGKLLILEQSDSIREVLWKKFLLSKYTTSSGEKEERTLGNRIRASNHLSARRNDEGWIIIFANRNVSSGTSLGVDMETGDITARLGLLGESRFGKREFVDYTIGFQSLTPQMSSTVIIGTLRGVRSGGGTSRLLIVTVKYRGNGMDQQFAIQQDLEIVADYLRENSKR